MCLLVQSIVSVAGEVLGGADPDKVTHRGLHRLDLGFILFPVVHHLRCQDNHRDDQPYGGGDEDTTQGVELDTLAVIQHWAVSTPAGVPVTGSGEDDIKKIFFFLTYNKVYMLLRLFKTLSFFI